MRTATPFNPLGDGRRPAWAGLFVVMASLTGCQSHAGRLAGAGAVTGAMAGAAIAGPRGNGPAGALIGSAIGAVSGAAIGDAIDSSEARTQAAIAQQENQRLAGALSVDDVIAMSRCGLSEQVIATHLRNNGVTRAPQVADLIRMRDSGVGDSVIQAMQDAGARPTVIQAAAPQTVIVQDPYPPPPVVVLGARSYCPPAPHVSWGFHYRH